MIASSSARGILLTGHSLKCSGSPKCVSNVSRCVSQHRWLSQQSSTEGAPIKRGTLRKQVEHENKLRRAINLYHGSHAFYPSIATRAGQERIGMIAEDGEKEHDRLPAWAKSSEGTEDGERTPSKPEQISSHDDQLDWFIRARLGEAIHMISKGNSSKNVVMRTANMVLDSHRNDSSRLGYGDLEEEYSRKAHVDHLFDYSQGQNRSGGSANAKTTPLPSRDDPDALKAYLAQATKQTAEVMRQSVSAAEGTVSSDNRTARVRDALFGTVQGHLPGLEVVRERARDARVRKESERLAQEEHDRRAGGI